jgi:hypothetical protein
MIIVDCMHAQESTCAEFNLRRTFRNVIIANVGDRLCVVAKRTVHEVTGLATDFQ